MRANIDTYSSCFELEMELRQSLIVERPSDSKVDSLSTCSQLRWEEEEEVVEWVEAWVFSVPLSSWLERWLVVGSWLYPMP